MSKTIKRIVGDHGESLACTWLRQHGFSILDQNVSNQFGEIDIIALKQNVVHFIEVKTRQQPTFGFGVDSVDQRKLRAIINTAQTLASVRFAGRPYCLDVLSIDQGVIRFFENITV